jgi:hypothetical protein
MGLNVLSPTLGRPEDRVALTCTAKLAKALSGQCAALFAMPDPADAFIWAGEGLTQPPSAEAIDAAREIQTSAENRVQAAIEAVNASVVLPSGIALLTRIDSMARATVEYLALHDMAVFSQDAVKSGGPMGSAFEAALLKARAPVLVAREDDIVGKPAFIAWDGGLEAGRAVRAALPILQKSGSVSICQAVSEVGDRARAGVDPVLLQARLRASEIDAQIVLVDASSSANAASGILELAGPGSLLVSGAYAHSRAQEMIFGGATRTFLAGEGPSLLLSH